MTTVFLSDFHASTCSNAEPLSRVATSANPRQLPMNRSVTLPADEPKSQPLALAVPTHFRTEVQSSSRKSAYDHKPTDHRRELTWSFLS